MNHCAVFFNTQIRDNSLHDNLAVAMGDFCFNPVRCLFNGNEVAIIESKVYYLHDDSKLTTLSEKALHCLRIVAAIVLLVPGLLLGTLFKGMGYLSQSVRDNHQMVVLHEASIDKPKEELWSQLVRKTKSIQLKFLSEDQVNHRFTDIFCPQTTAVVVADRYLHANKVGEGITKRAFVASQAPLEKDYETFWKAIYETNSTIFDLTTENDQTDGGVTKYYPDMSNPSLECESMSINLSEIAPSAQLHSPVLYYTDTYQLINKSGQEKEIKRFHYPDWKDFSVVSLSVLQLLVQKVEEISPDPKDVVWIHCRAGVGRTGTLITALILKEKIERGEINAENLEVCLIDILIKLRQQRGPDFVQQKAQLDLLVQYAHSLISS